MGIYSGMYYYKASLRYQGTNYFGFQWQKGIPTIQDDFNRSLEKLLPGKVSTVGASRTDTGVHAVEQPVRITTEHPVDCDSFLLKLNHSLPPAIRCLSLEACPGTYRPTSGHSSKEYRYLFTNDLRSSTVEQRFVANNPYELDLDLMKRCASMVEGKHDFRNFCSAGSNVRSFDREISLCELTQVDPNIVLPSEFFLLPPDLRVCHQLRIVGSGFLKQMVRHLMSALWLVGGGKLSEQEFSSLLSGQEKTKRFWKVATPRGLYLYRFD